MWARATEDSGRACVYRMGKWGKPKGKKEGRQQKNATRKSPPSAATTAAHLPGLVNPQTAPNLLIEVEV